MSESWIALAATILTLLIPIIAIILTSWVMVRKKQHDTELRRMIIENHTDVETAKALLAETEEKKDTNNYPSLRAGFVLIGLGMGALANHWLHIHGIYFWLVLAFGIGVGLLISFFVEMKIQERLPKEDEKKEQD